jgi:PAS domain S-box-containing protein
VRDEGGAIQDFLCLNINSAARGLLGIDASVPVGVTLTEVLADDEVRRDIIQRAGEVTDTGRDVHFETWLTSATNGGEPIRLDIWMGKIGDGAAVFFEDVTASREEERHLKQYRHCFAHMREAIVVTDLKGNIIDWNPSSESMFGYEKSEILGKHSVILTRSAETDLRRRSGANILSNEEVWTGEVEFVRSDGGRGIAFARVGLLKDDQGKPYGTVGLWHDLTERKRLEERLTVKTQELHEKNLALNTLLRHSEKERLRACEQVAKDLSRGMTQRVLQIVEVKRDPDLVETHARLLLKHLGIEDEFTGPDSVGPYFELSEKELEVARLVRLGKTTEEIAFVLDKSVDTVRLQRISIRKKLGLRQRHQSLGGYLRKMAPL